jgi:ubiquitin-activating enzyme E1 C
MITPPTAYPICTIANTPRLPEHCIEWASVLQWPKVKKGSSCYAIPERSLTTDVKLDTDDPDHIEWLYREASARAAEFKIEGVTWALTQGVVKNIIPAIASTNAIIAGEYLCATKAHTAHDSVMLQRSAQARYDLRPIPQQLHDVYGRRLALHVHF